MSAPDDIIDCPTEAQRVLFEASVIAPVIEANRDRLETLRAAAPCR